MPEIPGSTGCARVFSICAVHAACFAALREDRENRLGFVHRRDVVRRAAPWLYLNGPIVNSTGSLYSAVEISDLLAVAPEHCHFVCSVPEEQLQEGMRRLRCSGKGCSGDDG